MTNSKFNNFMHASEISKIILKLFKSKIRSDIFLVSCSDIINSIDVVKNSGLNLNLNQKLC